MRRRLAVLLVDALGFELAARTPGFAAALPHRRRLETVLGFSSGALPTLFTGRLPAEHGRWLMYRRAQPGVRTPFAGFRRLGLLPPRLRRSWKLSRLLTRLVERRGVRGYFSLYEVPRELLEEFDLAERDDIFAPGGLPGGLVLGHGGALRRPLARLELAHARARGAGGVPRAPSPRGPRTSCSATRPTSTRRCTGRAAAARGCASVLARYDAWLAAAARAAAGARRGAAARAAVRPRHGGRARAAWT